MPTDCFRFAPRDSVPGLIAKICKYLKGHPGWSEEELEEQIKQFIGQNSVESFNGRTGAVVLNEDDVNNLKIASAYFAEGDETINELDLVPLYNQGVRFVFTNWNSATSGYDLAFALDYFSGSNDVVYYPMATSSGGGNIVSVNGDTGVVFTLRVDPSDPGIPTDTPAPINATTLNGKGAEYYATAGSVNQLSQQKVNYTDALTLEEIQASTNLAGKIPTASALAQVVENQNYIYLAESGQSNVVSYDLSTLHVPAGVYVFVGGRQFAVLSRDEYGVWSMVGALNTADTSSLTDNQLSLYVGTWFGKCYYKRLVDA